MTGHEEAARLVGLRQQALAGDAAAVRAYGEGVGRFADQLRKGHSLESALNLLLSEIALQRNRAGLPATVTLAEQHATDGTPVDVHLEQTGPVPAHDAALVDRLGGELAARFPYWALTAANARGGVVSARPAHSGYPADWLPRPGEPAL